ncbi:MAG: tRNA pseudouridine(55) synthase TruB [Candidatus Dormibacteria bacterium]
MNGIIEAPRTRRGRAPARLHGVLALDKGPAMTSFQAVREVRRLLGERRVGHAGTLDPTATGLLPICVGQATRLVDYFHQQPKQYECVVRLGQRSTTLDTEGAVTQGAPACGIDAEAVSTALGQFVGEIEQVPPMHSAVRVEGRHLYELARAGEVIERQPRPVTIHSIELRDFRPGPLAEADLRVVCGKGTYMRVLAADLGEVLGTGGLLAWLERSRYGALQLNRSIRLDDLAGMDDPAAALLPPEVAVDHLPRVDLGPQLALQVQRGQSVWLPRPPAELSHREIRVHGPHGELVAVGQLEGGLFRPTKVLDTGTA